MQILPYKTIGIIGGGQLGRMLALSAKAMGYYVAVLDPTINCPCEQVSDMAITANYNDMDAIKQLAEICDIITYEFENIDYNALTYLEKNAYLPQGSHVLNITQHRYKEKTAIKNMGIPVPDFCLIESKEQLMQIFGINQDGEYTKKPEQNPLLAKTWQCGLFPCVLKTTTGGYDGKGQVVIKSPDDLPAALALASNNECILEKWMHFSKEVSVIVARSTTGEVSVFPVAENEHVNNILHKSIVPARISSTVEEKAIAYGKKIAEELNAIGLLAIEMFVVGDEIYINELAPRPHNSGHYTMDACYTSQFEQHIRAVCGLPLGDTSLYTPAIMVNILGDHMNKDSKHDLDAYMPLLATGKIHLYGKADAVDKRKMGHVNLLGDVDASLQLIDSCKIWT